MAVKTLAKPAIPPQQFEDDDEELQCELEQLVEKVSGSDLKLVAPSVEMLKVLIRTSTSSMTSVPKPLKYLLPFYDLLKITFNKLRNGPIKKNLADVISVLAMGHALNDQHQDCLEYCMKGTKENIGDWGHEYISQLEAEIVLKWNQDDQTQAHLITLVSDIIEYHCSHNAEIQACDLLMEIDQLAMLPDFMTESSYTKICSYLTSCIRFVDELERNKLLKLTCEQYLKFGDYCKALVNGILVKEPELIKKIFYECKDGTILNQMAFICARHLYYPTEEELGDLQEEETFLNILGNNYLSTLFVSLGRQLDILEPKSPENVFKSWLEPTPRLLSFVGGAIVESARKNLASSFVNGFVNAGFGTNALLGPDSDNKWIYSHKDHGMLSATASLGLVHLWDVDGGLTPIDKFLYSSENFVKAGALLALGMVNCRVKNDCDPALALLGEYLDDNQHVLQVGAILGLGLAYVGTNRKDILELIVPVISTSNNLEVCGVASLTCGLISLGVNNNSLTTTILNKMVTYKHIKSPHIKLMGLGFCLCFYGARDGIEDASEKIEVFDEPLKTIMFCMLQMCSYAGTGDVLIIQELLLLIGDKIGKNEDWTSKQAMAVLAVATIALGEELGMKMLQRTLGHVIKYAEPQVRKVVPLALALTSISDPQMTLIDVLSKYSHDGDHEVAINAIFGLGIVGAGTNNARLATILRSLAAYHTKNPLALFVVRIAQGLVHAGKGTLTLSPLHAEGQLIDPVSMAGLLSVFVAMLEPNSLILDKSHYLLYCLAAALQPRWLVTLDQNLQALSVVVRVGQAVDIVGKAGIPKTIAGIQTHQTPVLLGSGYRAELGSDDYEVFAPTLDGICILKKKNVE